MKRIMLCLSILTMVSYQTSAQKQAGRKDISADDILCALEMSGTFLYSFCFDSFNDEVYEISPFIEEYIDGKKIDDKIKFSFGKSKVDVRQFGDKADSWREFYGMAPNDSIYTKLTDIGVYVKHDKGSTAKLCLNIKNIGKIDSELKKRPATKGPDKRKFINYNHRPFRMIPQEGDDMHIPLVLYGSCWYDKRHDIYRFCGDKEISPDMSSEILKNIPHYFIIGIDLRKTVL